MLNILQMPRTFGFNWLFNTMNNNHNRNYIFFKYFEMKPFFIHFHGSYCIRSKNEIKNLRNLLYTDWILMYFPSHIIQHTVTLDKFCWWHEINTQLSTMHTHAFPLSMLRKHNAWDEHQRWCHWKLDRERMVSCSIACTWTYLAAGKACRHDCYVH